MRKPYEAAILFQHSSAAAAMLGMGGESAIDELIENDWDELVQVKGKNRLLHILKKDDDDRKTASLSPWEMLGRFSNPPMLLFFEQPLTTDSSALQKASLEDLSKKAKEIIVLSRWSRDDIKDMLLTLLP